MTAYERDAMIERRQIHEISLNVARRLHHVLDGNRYIPGSLAAEVDSTVRVITGIQRDVEQIMDALSADEALDFAILTHIMGGQRHALDLLEILEEKLDGGQSAYKRDSARVHQALLAVSREIEQDALRYTSGHSAPARPAPVPPAGLAPRDRTRIGRPSPQADPSPRILSNAKRQGPPVRVPSRAAALRTGLLAKLREALIRPVPVALTALILGACLVIAAQQFLGSDPAPSEVATKVHTAQAESAGAPPAAADPDPARPSTSVETAAVSPPHMEQPYLVVLSTRRSTEELQQDYRSFKGSYPDLLGNAKARVDRVQGLDQQTWYRLSLIPPQSHDDAKQLCSKLRNAGLSRCWIKSVPLH